MTHNDSMALKTSKTHRPALSQLTLRGFDAQLERRLREVARDRDLSLNRAALLLIRRGASLTAGAREEPAEVGGALDRFIGLWSRHDEEELLDAIQPFAEIDAGLWP